MGLGEVELVAVWVGEECQSERAPVCYWAAHVHTACPERVDHLLDRLVNGQTDGDSPGGARCGIARCGRVQTELESIACVDRRPVVSSSECKLKAQDLGVERNRPSMSVT